MDEVLSQAERRMGDLQGQMGAAANNFKDEGMRMVRHASDEGKSAALKFMKHPQVDSASQLAREAWQELLRSISRGKVHLKKLTDQAFIVDQLTMIFKDEIARNNAIFICIGLGIGTTCGYLIGSWLARDRISVPCMKAIACVSYKKKDNVELKKLGLPKVLDTTDVLIKVRAVSINRLDERISRGYGRALRCIIQRYHDKYYPELPLTLGRACAGIVEAVGKESRSGLEIGDEVWCVAPFYENGLASEMVVVSEERISRKPVMTGFEGAASLPYSGCIALNALQEAGILRAEGEEASLAGRHVLVQDGCSPVGCVLMQLCKNMGATITATCDVRSVPVVKALGADLVIPMKVLKKNSMTESMDSVEELPLNQQLGKENKTYDFIFVTTNLNFDLEYLEEFLTDNGRLVNTYEAEVPSDEYVFVTRYFYSMLVNVKRAFCGLLGLKLDLGGPHLCHMNLNRLADYVNDGVLQTVVDQVYTPVDAEKAIRHVCSERSIGSTIVTFR